MDAPPPPPPLGLLDRLRLRLGVRLDPGTSSADEEEDEGEDVGEEEDEVNDEDAGEKVNGNSDVNAATSTSSATAANDYSQEKEAAPVVLPSTATKGGEGGEGGEGGYPEGVPEGYLKDGGDGGNTCDGDTCGGDESKVAEAPQEAAGDDIVPQEAEVCEASGWL